MTLHDVSLGDRFDLSKRTVLLGGVQALVRAMLMQRARDAAAGLSTAGYATGYRGSPLGAVDQQMWRARAELIAADIRFEPGLNEDLAATALWGSQQAQLRGEGRVDGVFGLWYGKGPGVDRCGDVFRHANMAGTAPLGGVASLYLPRQLNSFVMAARTPLARPSSLDGTSFDSGTPVLWK
jgi:indolepyruvate ferredoxin oxidoreductase